MTSQQYSATIYEFPKRGRFAESFAASRDGGLAQTTPTVDYGSWYHDEAIREERERKH